MHSSRVIFGRITNVKFNKKVLSKLTALGTFTVLNIQLPVDKNKGNL